MNGGSAIPVPSTGFVVWRRFVGATVLGLLVAFAAFVALYTIFGDPGDALFPLLMVGVGLVFGAFQQRALAPALGSVNGWAIATALGFGVGIALAVGLGLGENGGFLDLLVQSTAAGAAVGAIVGLLQWRVLASRVEGARWWVPVSIAGWAAGAALGSVASHVDDGLDILIAPIVAAAIAGPALVVLRRPRPAAEVHSR
jgi:hypothetical protein